MPRNSPVYALAKANGIYTERLSSPTEASRCENPRIRELLLLKSAGLHYVFSFCGLNREELSLYYQKGSDLPVYSRSGIKLSTNVPPWRLPLAG